MRARVYIITALLLCTADQLSKLAAERFLKGNTITVIPGIYELELTYNKGIAFGMFSSYTAFFAFVALVMVVIITWLIRSSRRNQRLFRWALTFQLGGALGNLLDRALRQEGVVDFLHFFIKINDKTHSWPNFNFADICVVIGTFFLIIYLIKAPPPELTVNGRSRKKGTPEQPDLEEIDYSIGERMGLDELHPVDEFPAAESKNHPSDA